MHFILQFTKRERVQNSLLTRIFPYLDVESRDPRSLKIGWMQETCSGLSPWLEPYGFPRFLLKVARSLETAGRQKCNTVGG